MKRPMLSSSGPFVADQIRPGDRYELSDGHPLWCSPVGGRGAKASPVGAAVLGSDPAVESVGVDAGYTPTPGTLRAPDIAVGNVPDEPGWIAGSPLLAVEYADTGQDEDDLAVKIDELLAAGTRYLWVVRLVGPRRVEVHTPGQTVRMAYPGELLEAPGVLRNAVPVEALYDPEVGREVTLHHLLQRYGYESLDAVREEGRVEGKAEGKAEGRTEGEAGALREAILEALEIRGLAVPDQVRGTIDGCADPAILRIWRRRALTASSAAAVIES
jgi:hypothetical protein